MKFEIPTIRRICEKFDIATPQQAIAAALLEIKGDQLSAKPTVDDILNAWRVCEEEVGPEQLANLLKEIVRAANDATLCEIADNLDREAAKNLLNEYGEVRHSIFLGISAPRGINILFIPHLLDKLEARKKLKSWRKVMRSSAPTS